MGDEQDKDEGANALEEEQKQIRHLQVEIARKRELQKRVIQKKDNLKLEYEQRKRELQDLDATFRTAKERKGARTGKKDEAQEVFMRNQVELELKMRIPLLADPPDGEGEHDLQGAQDDSQDDRQENDKYHDTVQITYIYFTHPKDIKSCEEFLVTYRIGPETTVKVLLRDACAYWGCLAHEYGLYPKGAEDAETRGSGEQSENKTQLTKLDDSRRVQELLHVRKRSELFLVRTDEEHNFKEKRNHDTARELKAQKAAADAGNKSQEEGRVTSHQVNAPFVEALRHWPGVYAPVKDRSLDHAKHRIGLKFRNICILFVLILFCCLSIYVRSLPSVYLITSGVSTAIAGGIDGESSHPTNFVQEFAKIRHYSEIWDWAGGAFHYQLFNENSTLRKFHTPVAFLRVRQQKARARPGGCTRELPASLRRTCYYPDVLTQDRQEQTSLIPPVEWAPYLTADTPGRLDSPSPLDWYNNNDFQTRVHGRLQYAYDGSGYSMDFNLTNASDSFLYMIPFMRDWWVDTQTRMLVFEFLTANYNLDDGYAHTSMLIELGPSGTVIPFVEIHPLWIRMNDWEYIATYCDVVKGIIIFGYVCLIGFYYEAKRKGQPVYMYIVTFGGLLDICIGVCFVAVLVLRSEFDPPEPTTLTSFYSYNDAATLWYNLYLAESILLMLVIIRWTTFLKVVIGIYRFWKTFAASLRMFVYNLLLIVPVFLGVAFLGNALFSDISGDFATMGDSVGTMFLQTQAPVVDTHALQQKVPVYTVPYMVMFYVFVKVFFWNTFLAITAHSYFQVSLLENSNPGELVWTFDQWMDFILWPKVYQFIFNREPGSSRKTHSTEKMEEKDEDDDDDDDDDANN